MNFNQNQLHITNVINHDNFISQYDTNLNCQGIIDYYNFISSHGLVNPRSNISRVNDSQLILQELPPQYFNDNLSKNIYREWNLLTEYALKDYIKKYNILANKEFQHTSCKIQKTQPSQGYHQWHYEDMPSHPYRKLVTMLYLNDNFEAGETEFLYQQCRIKPKAGTFVIFPCSWPWTHRGNPPIKGDKYIVTAWVEHYPS